MRQSGGWLDRACSLVSSFPRISKLVGAIIVVLLWFVVGERGGDDDSGAEVGTL